jgi:hypothetical protein
LIERFGLSVAQARDDTAWQTEARLALASPCLEIR